jgi:transcriptional activator
MLVRVLGPVEVYLDRTDRWVCPRGTRQRTLLSVLATRPGASASLELLGAELWGGVGDRDAERPAKPANALQAHISRLRRLLTACDGISGRNPGIINAADGYLLSVDTSNVDAHVFLREIEHARVILRQHPERARELLRTALSRWRGRAFEGTERGPTLRKFATELERARTEARNMATALRTHRMPCPVRVGTSVVPVSDQARRALWGPTPQPGMVVLERMRQRLEAIAVEQRELLREFNRIRSLVTTGHTSDMSIQPYPTDIS